MPDHYFQNPDSYVARFPIISRHVLGWAWSIHSPTAARWFVSPSLLTSSYHNQTSNDIQILTSSIHFSSIVDSDCNMTTILENHGGCYNFPTLLTHMHLLSYSSHLTYQWLIQTLLLPRLTVLTAHYGISLTLIYQLTDHLLIGR